VVGFTAFASGAGYLTTPITPFFEARLLGILEIVLGTSLIIGFLTPIASACAALMGVGFAFGVLPLPPGLLFTRSGILNTAVVGFALMVLGAGAFSLDAYLFGRREIIIPDSSASPKY
jgi:uncharacterized membrane protein YphA (DoxX/SURF4 family)